MAKVTWPVVALVGMVLAAITILASMHIDPHVIFEALIALGLGGVLGGLSGIRSNVNGNLSKLIDHLAKSKPVDLIDDESKV